jgi:N-acetyl-alpha-D-glucosaminyl L-malate synthase BshA
LLGRDPGYGPAIRHALECADAVTVVSEYLRDETRRLLQFDRPIDVVHNFFQPQPPRRTREEVRQQLGVTDELVVLHSSNLRPVKRIDLLLEAAARVRPRESFRLVILAGEDFTPFASDVHRLGLGGQVVVLEHVSDIEDYLQAADLGLFASDSESFCLSILEAMCFGCPSVATRVGGIVEVVEDGVSGVLVAPGDAAALARAVEAFVADRARCVTMGEAARRRACAFFSADVIVPRYEAVYRRVCNAEPAADS